MNGVYCPLFLWTHAAPDGDGKLKYLQDGVPFTVIVFVLYKMGLGRERRVPLADVRCLAADYCCAWGIFVGGRRIAHDTLVASRNKNIYFEVYAESTRYWVEN